MKRSGLRMGETQGVLERMNLSEKESTKLVIDDLEEGGVVPEWMLVGRVSAP